MSTSAQELLAGVRRLLAGGADAIHNARARAAALLLRQTLEAALANLWRRRAPQLLEAPFSVQLLCLREYTSNKELAAEAARTWQALSDACHFRGYGLPPSRASLTVWLERVECLARAIGE